MKRSTKATLFQQGPDLEKLIQKVFHNTLGLHIMDSGYTQENLAQKLVEGIATTIRSILEQSKNCQGIRIQVLPDVIVIPLNCPEKYKALFSGLLDLKNKDLKNKELTQHKLTHFAKKIMKLESFREIDPTQFLLEAAGLVDPALHNIRYDENGVTPELIRETFYNEMVTQGLLAVEQKWLTYEDIADQESNIYFALPAMTILEAIQKSTHCDGIRLLNEKMLTNQNCPPGENFPELTQLILSAKSKIKSLSDEELYVIKHILSCEKELPEEFQALKTSELMNSVAVINSMATEISKRKVFHKMILQVLALCCETLKPQAPRLMN